MPAGPPGLPPGRAGRLWLVRRLAVARRAAELLERKERLLAAEELRLRRELQRATSAWLESWKTASLWTARAALVGGQRDLRPLEVVPAAVEVTWRSTMGISYPDSGRCVLDPAPPRVSPNPALIPAVDANRDALAKALDQAVAARAHALVAAELAATRRNLRAITVRRLPQLSEALVRLEERLDELEREEHVRTSWARRAR